MKLTELFQEKKPSLSFEVFPPKPGTYDPSVNRTIAEIALLRPSYMSVTFGAIGNTAEYSVTMAKNIASYGITPLAHLTCIASTKETVFRQLDELRAAGIDNILALRGDIPEGKEDPHSWYYHYASELMTDIREYGGFCIGGACYPEGHVESESVREDIVHLKEKVEAGCDFLTTQMFFDNNILYNFMYKLLDNGITVPVVPGIMPVTNGKQIKRSCLLSGAMLPPRFRQIIERYADDPPAMKQAGIAYATEQIIDLFANGFHAVHVYSMNKPDVAKKIKENLSEIIK